jgi:hypothetical protein
MHPLTDVWWMLFINRVDGALRGHKQGWVFTPQELEREEVSRALCGKQSLGAYAVDEHGMSKWLCLDADSPTGFDYLRQLAESLDPKRSVFELSPRGAHLWLLCPPTVWQQVHEVGLALVEDAPEPIEVFPKGPGRNGVRLPLSPHPKTGERYPIVDPSTGEIRSLGSLKGLQRAPLLPIKPKRKTFRTYPREFPPERGAYAELFRAIEPYTQLREYAPERAIGRCPFHDDQHPSLSLLGGFWRCWAGCGQGGLLAFRRLLHERGMEVMRNDV